MNRLKGHLVHSHAFKRKRATSQDFLCSNPVYHEITFLVQYLCSSRSKALNGNITIHNYIPQWNIPFNRFSVYFPYIQYQLYTIMISDDVFDRYFHFLIFSHNRCFVNIFLFSSNSTIDTPKLNRSLRLVNDDFGDHWSRQIN